MTKNNSILDKVINAKHARAILEFNPKEIVSSLLKKLDIREREVLGRRFNLVEQEKQPKTHKETLEKIGKSLGVTRERVRQIEFETIKKLKKIIPDKENESLKSVENIITELLEKYGGLMEEGFLLKKLLAVPGDTPLMRFYLLFIISQLLSDNFMSVKEDDDLRKSWRTKLISLEDIKIFLTRVCELLQSKDHIFSAPSLLALLKEQSFYKNKSEKLKDEFIISYLEASKKIKQNIFGQWGLASWPNITPKRMSDKIYLILKKEGKPLHFTKLAELINNAAFDKKVAQAATVHNELILEKKYVLVGRGIYALKEWGYKRGVVSDVIKQILVEAGRPLAKEKIIEEVLKQRIVRKATILLALLDKNKFQQLSNGEYKIIGEE